MGRAVWSTKLASGSRRGMTSTAMEAWVCVIPAARLASTARRVYREAQTCGTWPQTLRTASSRPRGLN